MKIHTYIATGALCFSLANLDAAESQPSSTTENSTLNCVKCVFLCPYQFTCGDVIDGKLPRALSVPIATMFAVPASVAMATFAIFDGKISSVKRDFQIPYKFVYNLARTGSIT